jgi:hypothetical protein
MAKTLAGVLAVSIAALLFAGCAGAGAGAGDTQSNEPVVEINTWCNFLKAVEALYIGIESCLIDQDLRESLPTSEQELEEDSLYYLIRFGAVTKCFEDLKRAEQRNGYDGSPVELDSSKVRSCARNRMEDLKFALRMEAYGVNELAGLIGQVDGVEPERPDGGWLINGDVYNDPWGLDYRNDPTDVYGDGR